MNLSAIPHSPGVYLMRDRSGQIIYVGKAKDLRKRMSSYFMDRADRDMKVATMVSLIKSFDYIPAESEREALLTEQGLIRRLQPVFNTMWRDDKTYPYVTITKEDYPRIFLTRQKLKHGGKYFGPYPNAGQIRSLLRYLWRQKFFPLRPCKYEFSEAKPLSPDIIRGCLYYHTKECPAPCAKRISITDYQAIANDAALFFAGQYKPLIHTWEKEMKDASAERDYERAAQLRDNVATLQHMNEHVRFRQVELSDVMSKVDKSRAVTDLQQALSLKRPPTRIECFDISHTQGVETVASMVVFEHGVAKKSDYRKFKIKTVTGIDDFASMGEVVGRRYRRLKDEHLPLPDLVLIDGGKGQLSAAKASIEQVLGKIHPPLASLAKREEELFLPDRPESIQLTPDSPARLLVQAIRDEAHRFAITFHRQRRAKRFLASE